MLLCGVGCANLPPFASASATDGCISCYGAPVCYTQSKRKVRAQGVTFNPSLTKAALPVPSRWPETLDPEKGGSRPEKGASQGMKTDRETAAVALARCSVGSSAGRPLALMETAEAIELFVSCERQRPQLVSPRPTGCRRAL